MKGDIMELSKNYDPKDFESRLYNEWLEKEYLPRIPIPTGRNYLTQSSCRRPI